MKRTSSIRVIRDYPRYGFELFLDKTWAGVSPSLRELIQPLPLRYLECFRDPEQVSFLLERLIQGGQTTVFTEVELAPSFRRAQLTLVREGALICGYLSPEPVGIAHERLLLQNQVSALYRSGNQIITIMDRQHRVLDFNNQAAVAAWVRFSRKMAQGECFTNYVQPDRIADFHESFAQVITGKTVVKERDIFAADGKSHRYEMMYTPIYDANNQVNRVCFSAIDVEEKRQTQLKLEQEQGFVSAMLNTTQALIFATDISGRVLRWNQACENLTGSTLNQVRNVPLFQSEILADDEREKLLEIYGETETLPSFIQFSLKDKSGALHPISWSLQVSTVADLPTLVVFTGLDMTQQQQMEEALAESESLLRQAQKMEAVGISAGSIAHDFNNLLTAIQGYSELLAMGALDAESRELNRELLSTCQKAKHLTRRLLMLSRRETEEQTQVDLKEVLEENAALFQQLAGSGVAVNYGAMDHVSVFMNRMHVEQVCLNLITNARDAMDGKGQVRLSLFRVTLEKERHHRLFGVREAGVYAVLKVEDTGPGVSPEVLPHIFDPFFTTKQEDRGTGLGLALVYRIVQKAGGWVDVKQGIQGGAIFEVYLPFYAEAQVSSPAALRATLFFCGKPEELDPEWKDYLQDDNFRVVQLSALESVPSDATVLAPFALAGNRHMKRVKHVLYFAEPEEIESELFDHLHPHEDVLIKPFSQEQLKYRILAMLS